MEENLPQPPRSSAYTSAPRPTAATIPTFPPGPPPTGTAGQQVHRQHQWRLTMKQTIQCVLQQDNQSLAQQCHQLLRRQTVTVLDIENMMWDTITSPQCSPMVLTQLIEAEFTLLTDHTHNDHLKVIAKLSNSMPIQRDSFIPTSAMGDTTQYLWFSWFTETQFQQFKETGTVPGYKETRGDNVHKHHRIHNRPDHCVNLVIHTRWNAQSENSNYGSTIPIFLVVWKTSFHNVSTTSHHQGNAYSSVYFR
eukprot:3898920-Amphidinium_carterae.1